jgi:sugar phosphate permease
MLVLLTKMVYPCGTVACEYCSDSRKSGYGALDVRAHGYLIQRFGWQMTFILEGLPPLVWAFFWIRIVDDHPEGAKWLDQESNRALTSSLEQEQLLLPPVAGMKQVLRNPAVILLCLQYFFWSIGVYGFVLWLPSIIQRGANRGIGITGLLSAVPYLFAIIAMVLVGYLSDASNRRKRFIWPAMMIAGAALFLSHLTAGNHFWVAYVAVVLAGTCVYAPYGPFYAIIPELLPSSVAGEAMALINSFGALGGLRALTLSDCFSPPAGDRVQAFSRCRFRS